MPILKLGEYWFPYFHITLPLHAIPSTKVANSSKVLLLLLEARKTKELGATRRPGLLVKRLHSYSMGTTGSTIGPLDGTPFQWHMGLLSKASPRGQWLQIRGPQWWITKYVQLIKARLGLDRCMKLVEIAFPGEILNETNRNRS